MKNSKYRENLLESVNKLQSIINALKKAIKNRYFMLDGVKIHLTPEIEKDFKSQIKDLKSDIELLLSQSKRYIK